MQLLVRQYVVPKEGNSESECEDACSDPMPDGQLIQHFAVADGATTSAFSRYWATLLVSAYSVGDFLGDKIEDCVSELQRQWHEHATGRARSWFVKEKILGGAHATLVGLTLFDKEADSDLAGKWRALAVGDACLFHVRNGNLLESFPILDAKGFDNSPVLISSIHPPSRVKSDLLEREGDWLPGDIFLLMTDAISSWLLSNHKEGVDLLERHAGTKEDFQHLIDELRKARDLEGVPILKNDDVTLMRIEVS
jgi:serine/threonine protein phosphatase PrpC